MKTLSGSRIALGLMAMVGIIVGSGGFATNGVVTDAEASRIFGGCGGSVSGPSCGSGSGCNTTVPGDKEEGSGNATMQQNNCGGSCTYNDPADCVG